MAMGIRRPGFQLLSLTSTVPSPDQITQLPVLPPLHTPCLMPDQLGIYFHIYIPLTFLSLVVLLAFNYVRVNGGIAYQTWNRKHGRRNPPEALHELSRGNSSHKVDADSVLPPVNKSRNRSPLRGRSYLPRWTWTFSLSGHRHRVTLPNPFRKFRWRTDHRMPQRNVGVLAGLLQDVVVVAWPPIVVFLAISCWVMRW